MYATGGGGGGGGDYCKNRVFLTYLKFFLY